MKFTYDRRANAVYISLRDLTNGEFVCRSLEGSEFTRRATLTFDISRGGKLIGIEILNAGQILDPVVLEKATRGTPQRLQP